MARKPDQTPTLPPPHVGAFVLETLTLGMYGEPRHTLREYVQNSFDAIRAAQRARVLIGRGVVRITIEKDSITISDNGIGIAAEQAWKTLTSVGASKKDRKRDAGFRGIGRLAGMAYCDELQFRTTFAGEKTLTTVTFDCKKLVKAMGPEEGGDIELSTLLGEAIQFEQKANACASEEHYFEVTMSGLTEAPQTLTDVDLVRRYLGETVPVDFNPTWPRRASIEAAYMAYFSAAIETIDLFVVADGSERQIFKPNGEKYKYAKGETAIEEIQFVSGESNQYWGWIGHLSESAAITDWNTRGLRVRVRNIQVDGTEIFHDLFSQVKDSYGRFSAYYVGEIHINPAKVVPNARRDGFEETESWLAIKRSLMDDVCEPLAREAYQKSQAAQVDVDKVVGDVERLIEKSHKLAESSRATYDQVVDLMHSARQLRKRAQSALKSVGDVDEHSSEDDTPGADSETKGPKLEAAARDVENVESQAKMLIGRFLEEDDRIAGLKERLRQQVIEEVLAIINPYVDASTYRKIQRQLAQSNDR